MIVTDATLRHKSTKHFDFLLSLLGFKKGAEKMHQGDAKKQQIKTSIKNSASYSSFFLFLIEQKETINCALHAFHDQFSVVCIASVALGFVICNV